MMRTPPPPGSASRAAFRAGAEPGLTPPHSVHLVGVRKR